MGVPFPATSKKALAWVITVALFLAATATTSLARSALDDFDLNATRNFMARLDPVTGAADSFNPNANGNVWSIAVQPDGKSVAAGNFSSIGGQSRNRLARLESTTGLADAFNPNAFQAFGVYSVALQQDGKIVAGGAFNTVGLETRNNVARIERGGRVERPFFDTNLSAAAAIYAIAFQTDGRILLGGDFTQVRRMTRNRIARLESDGSLDLGLTRVRTTGFPPLLPVVALQIFDPGAGVEDHHPLIVSDLSTGDE